MVLLSQPLLKRNGFEVYTGVKYDPKIDRNVPPYDEQIIAKRNLSPIHLYIWKTCRVYIYMKNGKVYHVLAHSFVDGL